MVPLGGDENIGEAVAGQFEAAVIPFGRVQEASPKGRLAQANLTLQQIAPNP